MLSSSHTANTLLDWFWVGLTFVVVAALVAAVLVLAFRVSERARRAESEEGNR